MNIGKRLTHSRQGIAAFPHPDGIMPITYPNITGRQP